MDWAALQNGLKAWFAAASGLHPTTIAWDGEAETFRAYPQAQMQLLKHAAEDGTDEVRWETFVDELGAEQLMPVVIGNRLVTLLITVHSRDQRAATKAFAVLDPVRTKLALPGSITEFDVLEVSVRDTDPTLDLGTVGEKRELSAASLAILLAYTVLEREDDEATVPIEHIGLGGTVNETTDIADQIIP